MTNTHHPTPGDDMPTTLLDHFLNAFAKSLPPDQREQALRDLVLPSQLTPAVEADIARLVAGLRDTPED